jgi:integrase
MGRAVDFCFPSLAKRRVSGRSGLSRTFRKIMEEAGVAAGVGRERKGSGGHTTTLRSFHSLRHTAASYTGQKTSKAASALLGHSGEAITERYLHAAFEELEEAVNSIPELEGVGV